MNDRYRKLIRGFGLYHALASLPLALPFLSSMTLDLLGEVHSALGLQGAWPNFHSTFLLFINLFATLAVFWGVFRYRHPSPEVGRFEGWAMTAFTILVLQAVWNGASPLWLAIALVDGVGAILHLALNSAETSKIS